MCARSLPSLFRSALRLVALPLLLSAAPALHATTITYDLTLSPASGVQAGTGRLTLASAPAAYGTSTYTIGNQELQDLTFTIDGQTFHLSGDPDASVQFTNGQLTSINFIETVDHAPARYTLEVAKGYTFYGNDFGHPVSEGSFSATPAVITPEEMTDLISPAAQPASPTPEPGSLLLLATALLFGGILVLRRKRVDAL